MGKSGQALRFQPENGEKCQRRRSHEIRHPTTQTTVLKLDPVLTFETNQTCARAVWYYVVEWGRKKRVFSERCVLIGVILDICCSKRKGFFPSEF